MPGTMSRADLVFDLEAMLMDAASKFSAADQADTTLNQCLDAAARDLGRFRPRIRTGALTLIADQSEYTAPADFLRPLSSSWGQKERASLRPWETGFPETLPKLSYAEADTGQVIVLSPAPTAIDIGALGSSYPYKYFAGHVIGAAAGDTSIKPGDRHLLLLRALIQALTLLAVNGMTKPVQLGPGVGAMPKNGTPAALAEQLYKQFTEMAA